jgi:hypothetical protein
MDYVVFDSSGDNWFQPQVFATLQEAQEFYNSQQYRFGRAAAVMRKLVEVA